MPFLSWVASSGGGGSGTVTTVSVVSANGFAGTVANSTTTPAITLSESVNGLLKGSGGALAAATAADVPGVAGVTVSGTPTTGQVLTATSSSAADWAAGGGGAVSSVAANDGSVVISPTTGAVKVNTATLDVIATDQPPAANWSNNSHKITSLANGSGAQDAAAFGQIPTASSTAGNFQPIGVATAGSIGHWSDAGHIHPYEPWQFLVEASGAIGDGKLISDAAITSASHTLTSASANFTSGDVGKAIYVVAAGAAGADLVTTISAFTNSTTVTLTAAAGSTVTASGCIYGTDNTAAIKTAQAAAVTYAEANHNYAEIVFQPLIYCVAGAATVGGGTLGNAIFPLPIVADTSPKLTLAFRSLQRDVAAGPHWLQVTPPTTGTTIAVLRLDGTNDATFGPASVFGGPADGYGGAGLFDNICPVVDGIGILIPFNGTFGGWDFFGCAEAYVPDALVSAMAVVPSGQPWPQFNNSNITNGWPRGLRMPSVNNNDRCDVGYFTCYGINVGFSPSEHSTWVSTRTHYCGVGVQPYGGSDSGNVMQHGMYGIYSSAENCFAGLSVRTDDTDTVLMYLGMLDIEDSDLVYDPDNRLYGELGFAAAFQGPGYISVTISGAANAKITAVINPPGPVASPHAAPSSGSAWANNYYRDAWITLSATTITAVSINSTAQAITGTPATYSLLVPSGQSYTPTYTGTLTHTVTLL